MIDLHTHTNYSDGTWTLKELLTEAQKKNIEILSITDHDSVKSYFELQETDYSQIFSGKIIPGIEFTTVYDGVYFHMLAYNFDYVKIQKFLDEKYTEPDLNKEFDYMYNSCKKNGVKLGDIKFSDKYKYPVDLIWEEMRKYDENKNKFNDEEWNNVDTFFNSAVTQKDFPASLDMSIHYPSADVVAKAVHEAGGMTFIAHAYRYKLKETEKFVEQLIKDSVIDGIEVFHSSFSEEQENKLLQLAKQYNMLISGGTDCHGMKKPDRKIGVGYGNMNVSKEIIKNWKSINWAL